jgi:hypothetical protein
LTDRYGRFVGEPRVRLGHAGERRGHGVEYIELRPAPMLAQCHGIEENAPSRIECHAAEAAEHDVNLKWICIGWTPTPAWTWTWAWTPAPAPVTT